MKMLKKILFSALIISGLSGCATDSVLDHPLTPGKITESKAVFDGVRELKMKPAWTLETDGLKLGLFWRSTMKDRVIVIAEVSGAQNFDPVAPLLFKIDGKNLSLKPANKIDFGGIETENFLSAGMINQTQKAFVSNKAFLKKALSAKSVLVRAQLLRGYVDGRFSLNPEGDKIDGYEQILAYNGFSKFYKTLWP